MWKNHPYWLRGFLIGIPIGILFLSILFILEEPDFSILFLTILPGTLLGGLIGGLMGSIFDCFKQKKYVPLIVFGSLALLLLFLINVTKNLVCC